MKENDNMTSRYKTGRYKIDQSFIEECDRCFEELLEDTVKKLCHASDGVKVMGLTGPTCSGKTTAAKKLLRHFGELGKKVVTVSLDDFFKDCFSREELANAKVEELDFDSPDTLDTELLSRFVDEIFTLGRAEKPIPLPFLERAVRKYTKIENIGDGLLGAGGVDGINTAKRSVA